LAKQKQAAVAISVVLFLYYR